jgi:histidine kinase/DNA gyrase B/HSP90-like ATPase
MNRSRFARWPLWRRQGRLSQGPEAALFHGLRIRLTLWYCLVLCAALVLFCVILYLGARYFLLNPVEEDAARHAHGHVQQWLNDTPYRGACPLLGSFGLPGQSGPPSGQPFTPSEIIVCYDQNGSLPSSENTSGLPSAFLNNNLVKMALQTGQPASDTVNGGGTLGSIYRYAQVVPNPVGSGYVGVVLVGETIKAQESALSLLLLLLLSIGGLTLLRADAEVLLRSRERLASEDAELLEDIVTESNHMSTLATNMLTLARLDNNSSHREHEVVNLTDVAHAGVRRVQALADQSGIALQVEPNDTVLVIGDPTLLEQAVLVLLDNAIKYNRSGGRVTVDTAVTEKYALLEVSDTGIGIAAEHLPHLGERFYRVDKSRSREGGGTGLGLSIARSIAEVHGGALTLTSIPDQGTMVTIKLPLAHGTPSDHEVDAQENSISLPEKTF